MRRIKRIEKSVSILMALLMVMISAPVSTVFAAMVGTEAILTNPDTSEARDKLRSFLDRKEVQSQLTVRGIDPAEAKALYRRAKKAREQEDHWRTIQLCQQAIEIVTDRAEYYHLLGLAQSENPKWRLDAERNLKIATNLDPWKSKYLSALGTLYLKAGMKSRAQRTFEQAKAVDPTFEPPES